MTSAGDRMKMERFLSKAKRLRYRPANQATMETIDAKNVDPKNKNG